MREGAGIGTAWPAAFRSFWQRGGLGAYGATGVWLQPFLYELPAGSDPRGEGSPRLFAGGLRLRPGVAAYLVRFEPLLRPLIQQRWAQRVAGLRAAVARQPPQYWKLDISRFGHDLAATSSCSGRTGELRRSCMRDRFSAINATKAGP